MAPTIDRTRSGARLYRAKKVVVAAGSASRLANSSQWVTSRRVADLHTEAVAYDAAGSLTTGGGPAMNFGDRRTWYAIAAVIVVLLIIAWAAGWLGGAAPPETAPAAQ